MFSLPQSQFLGLFLESILYGILLVTFGISLRCFFWDARGSTLIPFKKVKRGMLAMMFALFTIATTDILLAFVDDYDILSVPENFLSPTLNSPVWFTTTRVSLLFVQNLLGTSIWLYRCWRIYDRHWSVLVLPGIFFIATAGFTLSSFVVTAIPIEWLTLGGFENRSQTAVRLITAAYASGCLTSLLTTVLIVFRLWKLDREVSRYIVANELREGLGKVIFLIIESGIMFTSTELFSAISSAFESDAGFVAVAMDMQVIPIAFNLIIIFPHMISRDSIYPGTSSSSVRE
ncbi:hypothetical protein BT96DRAFT_1025649 [Gymnopus androsaceus JB14]|uniref:Serpentine receptor class gamma n=1 Tax=Gymnopus androsaceus JB14 TaxID=1447944 RepID=A0A6A4GQ58_9AGAR|nr:hypothetical protein BT96DRAFT_1025649 [Gymnopus androsaceus JB14]